MKRKQILLPAANGKSLNVVGLMTRKNNLFFEMQEGTFNENTCIRFMNSFVAQTVNRTAGILDNSPIHRPRKVRAKIEE